MMQATEHENMRASDNHQGEHTSAGGGGCNDKTLDSTSIWTVGMVRDFGVDNTQDKDKKCYML